MNKTLFGLAFLTYNWEKYKKDITHSYIPLVCSIIKYHSYSKITREVIKKDFSDTYGIEIPLGAIENILRRMAKDEFLIRKAGEYEVVEGKVHSLVNEAQKNELNNGFDLLIRDIQAYSLAEFSVELEKEKIELGLITFFKENDLDILFASNNSESVLPKVKESKKSKYIIAKFITDLQNNDPSKFSLVVKLSKGYAIASLITYEDIQHFSGNLSKVEVFLDAPVMFNLLGLNGESNLNLTSELIEILKSQGAKLRVFVTNYNEVIRTIENAIKRLVTRDFDISRSSRILRTAIRENISPQQLQIKLNQFDDILVRHDIQKQENPTLLPQDFKYQIDLHKLQLYITDLYEKNISKKVPWYIENKIEKDVESISNIFKIRKGNFATSLKNCLAIFLTSNEVISYAAKKFERQEWDYKSAIPVCITDIFLSSILWANYPLKSEKLNLKQLISECYSIIELDNKLLTRFYSDIKRMNDDHSITDEQFYLLSSSNISYTLLEQKTFNDIEEYTDKTPKEILEDIQLRLNADLNNEKEKLSKIDKNIQRVAKFLGKAIFLVIALMLIAVCLIVKAQNPNLGSNLFNIMGWIISGLFAIFGLMRWMELIPTKLAIETKVESLIYRKLKKWLSK